MAKDITNEQLFEFMTKMYGDLSGRIDSISGEMQGISREMQEGFKEVKQDIVRLENKMDINHKALYDGYKLTYERLTMLEEKVDEIDKKVERQDVEIRVIKGANPNGLALFHIYIQNYIPELPTKIIKSLIKSSQEGILYTNV